MSTFQLFAVLAALTALTAFANQVVFKLRGALGMAIAGAAISLVAFLVGVIWPSVVTNTESLFSQFNFSETVSQGMLCFLIFASAMHLDLRSLYRWRYAIGLLTTVGILISTLVVAFTAYLACTLTGIDIPWPWLLVFGAIVSPTDPVAVMALLKQLGVSKDLETKIAGESLLNDGTALVLFAVFLGVATNSAPATFSSMGVAFIREALGGVFLGLVLGFAGNNLLKLVNDAPTSVVMTLAYALGGYALGEVFHVSGPLVAAVMGLMVGQYKRKSMSELTKEKLVPFWEMFDELLNMALFLMIGMALIALPHSGSHLAFGALAIVCALVGRFFSVSLPLSLDRKARNCTPRGTVQAMVWGGVRGGVSLAMAMSLPQSTYKAYLVTGTWAVVMFSLLVQAPTMHRVLSYYGLTSPKGAQ